MNQLQVEPTQQENISISINFDARKHQPLHYNLKELKDNQALRKLPVIPKNFVIYSVYENIRGPKKFIEILEKVVPEFYKNVGKLFKKK